MALLSLTINAQQGRETEKFHWKRSITLLKGVQSIHSDHPFTGIVFQANGDFLFRNTYLLIEEDTIHLSQDDHATFEDGRINSNLISFEAPIQNLQLFSPTEALKFDIHFINGSLELGYKGRGMKNSSGNCEEPVSIDQSVWRNGLKKPDYERSFHQVKHLIIHHSAGNNSNTNYTEVVRNIYIYHTEVNGWSDIGYNYLIAQNGSIFKGRDPENGAQDNVRGAHFCGKNSNTMGVCLLGTYTDIVPTDETISSLVDLLTWKSDIESLDPYGNSLHSGSQLNNVAGHRDGCSTECPGQQTYDKINAFKKRIADKLANCDGSNSSLEADFDAYQRNIEVGSTVLFYDQSTGDIQNWKWTFEGGTPSSYSFQQPSEIFYAKAGVYDAQLIVSNGNHSDTLLYEDFIRVSTPDLPRVTPNVVNRNQEIELELEIDNPEFVEEIFILDIMGKRIATIRHQSDQILLNVNGLQSGTYFVQVVSRLSNKTARFIVL